MGSLMLQLTEYLVISGAYYDVAEMYIKGWVSMIQVRIPSGNL